MRLGSSEDKSENRYLYTENVLVALQDSDSNDLRFR